MPVKYLLLDTNLVAGYYLPRSLNSIRAKERIQIILDSVRSNEAGLFLYIPNFCIAETFSVFAKHAFGHWNKHVKKKRTIDKRVYDSICDQFVRDIHNGNFFYHYELSRYHVLAIDLVAPIDHYYQITRGKKNHAPMGAFDHLIIAMGIHLAHIHGNENVCIVSADDRLTNVLEKCKSNIPPNIIKKLKLDSAQKVTGKEFSSKLFPMHLNLKTATNLEMTQVFGSWPLMVGEHQSAYRWVK
jgi:hypothetical protein